MLLFSTGLDKGEFSALSNSYLSLWHNMLTYVSNSYRFLILQRVQERHTKRNIKSYFVYYLNSIFILFFNYFDLKMTKEIAKCQNLNVVDLVPLEPSNIYNN